jgi:nicotinate phosphoribosyltransferase
MDAGYDPIGVRLDSGDLAHLSKRIRGIYEDVGQRFNNDFANLKIVASNEINEEILRSLNQQGHQIDIFGIGTHLVTCQKDPSLGCVYKLVQVREEPRIKLSEDVAKMTFPGKKEAYRLYGKEGYPLVDLMIAVGEEPPRAGRKVLCCHPFEEAKRAYVNPARVEPLHHLVWDGHSNLEPGSPDEIRNFVIEQIASMREDHVRPLNPTPYKISLSEKLFGFVREMWRQESPIKEIK